MYNLDILGTFNDIEIDKWYGLYANLYLYFADDNLQHFLNRDIDINPIRNTEDKSKWADLYKTAALEIYNIAKTQIDWTKEEWFDHFPALKELLSCSE